MKPGKIRALAICLVRHDDRILVTEYHDKLKRDTFYRPLGGTVEFGERGSETVIREFMEEIHTRLVRVRYLGTLENIFTYNGQQGHEIVLVYSGVLADQYLYSLPVIIAHEDDGEEFSSFWMPIEGFRQGQAILYPDHVLDLLPKK